MSELPATFQIDRVIEDLPLAVTGRLIEGVLRVGQTVSLARTTAPAWQAVVTRIVIYDRDVSEIEAGLTAAAWLQPDGAGSPPLERGEILATVSTRLTGER